MSINVYSMFIEEEGENVFTLHKKHILSLSSLENTFCVYLFNVYMKRLGK